MWLKNCELLLNLLIVCIGKVCQSWWEIFHAKWVWNSTLLARDD